MYLGVYTCPCPCLKLGVEVPELTSKGWGTRGIPAASVRTASALREVASAAQEMCSPHWVTIVQTCCARARLSLRQEDRQEESHTMMRSPVGKKAQKQKVQVPVRNHKGLPRQP